MPRTALPLLAFLLALAACDSANDETRVQEFAATVSGDISASFSGIPDADRDLFEPPSGGRVMIYDFYFNGSDSLYSASVSLILLDDLLQAQSYPIVPTPGQIPYGSASAAFGISEPMSPYRGFRNLGGTLTITRVSGDQVEGRLEFTASDDDPSQEVEVAGEFEAELTERDE